MLPFEDVNVLVIGDVMLDRYWYGDTGDISVEAPVPVIQIKSQHESPGGAGNVASNIRSLGAMVTLMGMVGDDQAAAAIEVALTKATIKTAFQREATVQTSTKLRIISQNQQLLRIDAEENYLHIKKDKLVKDFNQACKKANMIVLSDYAKGTLSDPQVFIKAASKAKLPILVDPKGCDFAKYRGASILTPNLKEFEEVVGPCANDEELINKGNNLLARYDFAALLITRGECGMTLLRPGQTAIHLPAESREVYDVTGAGDTVIAVLASVLATGASLEKAMEFANYAAGIVVSRLGTARVSAAELADHLQYQQADKIDGVYSKSQLARALAKARAACQRVVMVHGCFDILHAGVIEFLQQAKRLGDILLVAVEDDAELPILNTLQHRAMVLQALEVVDWVIPYQKESLDHLIKTVAPEVVLASEHSKTKMVTAG